MPGQADQQSGRRWHAFTRPPQRLHVPCVPARCPRGDHSAAAKDGGAGDRGRPAGAGSMGDLRSRSRRDLLPAAAPLRRLLRSPARQPVTGTPAWAWMAAGCVIAGLLAIDLIVNRGQPGMRRAVLVSAAWVGAGVVFGIAIVVWQGGDAGQEYFAAYLVEKALSVDNIFVF